MERLRAYGPFQEALRENQEGKCGGASRLHQENAYGAVQDQQHLKETGETKQDEAQGYVTFFYVVRIYSVNFKLNIKDLYI